VTKFNTQQKKRNTPPCAETLHFRSRVYIRVNGDNFLYVAPPRCGTRVAMATTGAVQRMTTQQVLYDNILLACRSSRLRGNGCGCRGMATAAPLECVWRRPAQTSGVKNPCHRPLTRSTKPLPPKTSAHIRRRRSKIVLIHVISSVAWSVATSRPPYVGRLSSTNSQRWRT